MDGVVRALKNVVFRKVKSDNIVIDSPKNTSIMYLYFSVEEIMEELKEIARTPAIPETLMIRKDIRKCNSRNICCLEFFSLSDQSLPILQQVYRKDNYLDICDHMDVDVDNNT